MIGPDTELPYTQAAKAEDEFRRSFDRHFRDLWLSMAQSPEAAEQVIWEHGDAAGLVGGIYYAVALGIKTEASKAEIGKRVSEIVDATLCEFAELAAERELSNH
jgi:hypothetical protein